MASKLALPCVHASCGQLEPIVYQCVFSVQYLIAFHTMLDAVGNVSKVHYEMRNVRFYFHKVA